jgi:hypothetical protein
MLKLNIVCIVIVALFVACNEQPKQEEFSARLSELNERLQEKKHIYDFAYPDSIDPKNIIVSYYELHFDAHSVMYYTDTTKTMINVARYFPDSTLLSDKLKPTKFNEFRSLVNNAEYVITEDHVNYILGNQGLAHSYEHIRTDGNRY